MLLAIDIGNSNITLGFFSKNKLIEKKSLATNTKMSVKNYSEIFTDLVGNMSIEDCIISSVVPEIDKKIEKIIYKTFKIKPTFITIKTNLGIKIKSKNPETAGADRIVNVAAAKNLYKYPAIVIDIGSAITFDIIDNNGDFIGGLIMPGLNLQLKSLYDYTSKLPMLEINPIEKTINNDTKNSILSGVIRGTACSIDGLIEECKKELKTNPYIILSGGNSEFMSKYIKNYDTINPNLTLEGLNIIYDYLHK